MTQKGDPYIKLSSTLYGVRLVLNFVTVKYSCIKLVKQYYTEITIYPLFYWKKRMMF